MSRSKLVLIAGLSSLVIAVFFLGRISGIAAVEAEQKNRVFEIRTYTANEGKLDDLVKRFREHTCQIFEKHGMTNIGYWVPQDEPRSKDSLIYVIAHESREAAKKNWEGFRNDPDWKQAAAASEVNGKLLAKAPESVYADPTDFSPIK